MTQKMPQCCTRYEARVASAEVDLGRLARRAARRPDGPSAKMRQQLLDAQAQVANIKQRRENHLFDDTLKEHQ